MPRADTVVRAWTERYRSFTAPTDDGLPNRRVLFWPLALLAILLVTFVALGLTGSSSGVLYSSFHTDNDPDLLANEPLPIRSDEWYVQTSWTISQVEQGLPIVNEAFPGGMDATVQHDLPTWDWSTAFRPHLLGFWFLPLDQAMALKWWLPGFALIAAVFLFVVSLLPRRPVAAMMTGIGFFFAPFFHWWYLSITFYPVVWALLVMAGTIWMLRRQRGPSKWIWATVIAYITVTVGTGIYVPFIVPAVYVAAGFVIGITLSRSASPLNGFRTRIGALVPLFLAAGAALAVMAVWLITRWRTIEAFTSTVYPGERLESTGHGGLDSLKALLSGVFSVNLDLSDGAPFASNPSEASSFLLPGLFLAIPLAWAFVRSLRTAERDWLALSLLIVAGIFTAFMFVPGWDPVAHVLLLDRTTLGRLQLGYGLLSLVIFVVVMYRVRNRRAEIWPTAVAVIAAGAWTAALAWNLVANGAVIATGDYIWVLVAAGFLIVVGAAAMGYVATAAIAFLVISIVSSAHVNPMYRGVFDLNDTRIVHTMKEVSEDDGGRWVGVSETALPTVLLVQSGLPSFSGFQSSPSKEMWNQIDPGLDEEVWNRLANVSWGAGDGPPDAYNPAPDQIRLTFDSCGAFAQEHVSWVLTDEPLDQECVELVDSVREGPTRFRIYEVTPAE